MQNENRVARFTSSNSHKLIKMGSAPMNKKELVAYKKANPTSKAKNKPYGFAAPGLTYIDEKRIEARMQTCLDADGAHSIPLAWGKFMEFIVFSLLGTSYQLFNKTTFLHPKHGKFWSGSTDMIKHYKKTNATLAELKCYQKKKFAQYTDLLIKPLTKTFTIKDKLTLFKKLFPEEYWQLISNAHIHSTKYCEAITFMPYESQYDEIVEMAHNYDGPDQWKYRFITEKPITELPFLKDGGYYKNLNIFLFDPPKEDLDFIELRMIEASKLLFKKQ